MNLIKNSCKINDKGLNLLKTFEGCRLTSYRDIGGILTIGYGHTGSNVYEGQHITQDQADSLLLSDIAKCEEALNKLINVPVTSNQFSALICLVFNIGIEAFSRSTLLKLINLNKMKEAAEQFIRWDHVNGKQVEGLRQRRLSERRLFLS